MAECRSIARLIIASVMLVIAAQSLRAALPAARVGDVNGDGRVTVADAVLALRDSLGLTTLPDDQRAVAALMGKKPYRSDAQAILRAALGLGRIGASDPLAAGLP